jgi:hypothetical protein
MHDSNRRTSTSVGLICRAFGPTSSCADPDPFGSTLVAVRRFLAGLDDAHECALFWEYVHPPWAQGLSYRRCSESVWMPLPRSFVSVAQKNAHGERTTEELAVFKSALPVMNRCYASICGTAVVQLKDVPPRPAEYDGRVTIFDLCPSFADEEMVRADLGRFGDVVEAAVEGGVATARFASHEEAERCVAALCDESRGACCVYNATHYSRDRGEPYSGWCARPRLSPAGTACVVSAAPCA